MMNYSKKYVRVKKPPTSTPITFLTSTGTVTATPVSPIISRSFIKAEPLSEVVADEDDTAKTFLHSTNDGDPNNMNPRLCGGLSTYPSYAGRVDGLGKQFSSTTIVNGAAIPQFDGTCTGESVLVMPLDTLQVPVNTSMAVDDDIQTIHIGDYSDMAAQQRLYDQDIFIAPTDSSGTCYVTVQREKPKKSVNSIPTPKNLQNIKQPSLGGGKRGLIRFGRSRMIADSHTSIAVSEFKSQLNDTSDIVGKFDIAPSTKRLMYLLNTKGVNKLFANPGRKMGSQTTKSFIRHLTLRQMPVDMTYDDMPLQPVGYTPHVDPSTIKRITRKRRYPEAEEYQQKLFNSQMQLVYFNNNIDMEIEEPDPVFIHEEVIVPDSHDNLLDPMDIDVEIKEECTDIYTDEIEEVGLLEQIEEDDSEEIEFPVTENKPTIIMVHEGEETAEGSAYSQQNIEVLLAAAEKRGISRGNIQQVIICQGEMNGDTTAYLPSSGQVVIMPNDPMCETITETVLSS